MPTIIEFKRKDGSTYSVEKNFGDNHEEAVALYGSDVVYGLYLRQAIADCRNRYRAAVEDNVQGLDESIQAWEPGKGSTVKLQRVVDPIAVTSKAIAAGKVTLEQLEAWRAELLAKQG